MLKSFVALCVGLASVVFFAASASAAELKVLIWSDYIDPDLVKAFEAKTSSTVRIDVYEETEAMLAKLQVQGGGGGGGSGYDIVVASDHAIPVLVKLGLVQKLDGTKISNTKNLEEKFAKAPYDPTGAYSRPYQWGTVGLMYNKKKIGEANKSWGLIFDAALRKSNVKFLMLDSPRDTLGAALKRLGSGVNSRDTKTLQNAGKLVLSAKGDPNCIGFDGSVSAAKRVISGQADVAMVYNGDALNAIKDSKSEDFDYFVPTEGSIIWVDTMVIPTGAKQSELAHSFINFILDAENGAKLSNYVNFATPNAAAMSSIDETSRKNPRIYPTPEQIKTLEYLEDVADATRLYDAVWTAVKAR